MSLWTKREDMLRHTGMKILVYGKHNTGKSMFVGTFPRINLIDSEDGQTFYLRENSNILNVIKTMSAATVQQALDELNDEEFLKNFDTIAIDSGTKLYENMQSAAYEIVKRRARKKKLEGKNVDMEDLNLAPRDWGHIRRWNQELATAYILMSSLGKIVVVTAHEQEIKDDKQQMVIGYRPDLAKKAEHDFDIILRTFTEKDPATGQIKYKAEVIKDRTPVTTPGQILENISFDIWKDFWVSTKKLGVKAVDMSNDVETSVKKMQTEDEKLAEYIDSFKVKMKALNKDDQIKVTQKLKDLNIGNPLRTNNIEGMRQINEFIDNLNK